MPRWKATEQILDVRRDGEVFNPNWADYESIFQYMPEPTLWLEKRAPRIEEVDIWEVISEWSGLSGVYAAWCPYAELYIVTDKWKIVAEFSGWNANKRLENYLIKHKISYPRIKDKPTAEHEPLLIVV